MFHKKNNFWVFFLIIVLAFALLYYILGHKFSVREGEATNEPSIETTNAELIETTDVQPSEMTSEPTIEPPSGDSFAVRYPQSDGDLEFQYMMDKPRVR